MHLVNELKNQEVDACLCLLAILLTKCRTTVLYALLCAYSSASVLSWWFPSFPTSTWLPTAIKHLYSSNLYLSSQAHLTLTLAPLRISTSCSRTTTAPFCIVCAIYGSAVDRDRCSGPRFQKITNPVKRRLGCKWQTRCTTGIDEIRLSSSTGNHLSDLNVTKLKTREGHRHHWALFWRAVSSNSNAEIL